MYENAARVSYSVSSYAFSAPVILMHSEFLDQMSIGAIGTSFFLVVAKDELKTKTLQGTQTVQEARGTTDNRFSHTERHAYSHIYSGEASDLTNTH